jgi:hypothetical protein
VRCCAAVLLCTLCCAAVHSVQLCCGDGDVVDVVLWMWCCGCGAVDGGDVDHTSHHITHHSISDKCLYDCYYHVLDRDKRYCTKKVKFVCK